MNHYRVISAAKGIAHLQARRPVLWFLWRTIATGCPDTLRPICLRMEMETDS